MEIPFGFIENEKLFREPLGDQKAVEVGAVANDNIEKLVDSLQANFQKLEAKLAVIEKKISSTDNKGSFRSALLDIKNKIPLHKGLGDYATLLSVAEKHEVFLNEYVAKNRQKNTDIKSALLLELDAILENNDMQEAFDQIQDLKSRWIKTGSAAKEVANDLELRYNTAIEQFFEKRKSFLEAKNLLKVARVEDYCQIIEEIKKVLEKGDLSKSLNAVKELQKSWKEAGHIPEEDFKKLNEEYWKTCQLYFDKLKSHNTTNKKSKTTNEKDILLERKSIIEKLKSLTDRFLENVNSDFEELKKSWKTAGSLSKSKYEKIQVQFNELATTVREQQFVLQLAHKKHKDFETKSEADMIRAVTQVLKNLLRRDEDELHSFTENMDKMHINKGSFVDMLESKLATQQKKVELKKNMLKIYKGKLENLKH